MGIYDSKVLLPGLAGSYAQVYLRPSGPREQHSRAGPQNQEDVLVTQRGPHKIQESQGGQKGQVDRGPSLADTTAD